MSSNSRPAWERASTWASVGALLTGASGIIAQVAHLLPVGSHTGQILLAVGVMLGGANTLCQQVAQKMSSDQAPGGPPV